MKFPLKHCVEVERQVRMHKLQYAIIPMKSVFQYASGTSNNNFNLIHIHSYVYARKYPWEADKTGNKSKLQWDIECFQRGVGNRGA